MVLLKFPDLILKQGLSQTELQKFFQVVHQLMLCKTVQKFSEMLRTIVFGTSKKFAKLLGCACVLLT